MLIPIPPEISKKIEFKDGLPVAIEELNEEEQKIFDELYEAFKSSSYFD